VPIEPCPISVRSPAIKGAPAGEDFDGRNGKIHALQEPFLVGVGSITLPLLQEGVDLVLAGSLHLHETNPGPSLPLRGEGPNRQVHIRTTDHQVMATGIPG